MVARVYTDAAQAILSMPKLKVARIVLLDDYDHGNGNGSDLQTACLMTTKPSSLEVVTLIGPAESALELNTQATPDLEIRTYRMGKGGHAQFSGRKSSYDIQLSDAIEDWICPAPRHVQDWTS